MALSPVRARASASASPSASGCKRRNAEKAFQLHPGLGAAGLQGGVQSGGLGGEGGGLAFQIVVGHDAHLDGKAAVGGGDVMGGAAFDRADMQGREGRMERGQPAAGGVRPESRHCGR